MSIRARLQHTIRKGRRATIYKMLAQKHAGKVPCFVCGVHVEPIDATLEHIIERRNGGTDDMANLSISHGVCNRNRDKIERARAAGGAS